MKKTGHAYNTIAVKNHIKKVQSVFKKEKESPNGVIFPAPKALTMRVMIYMRRPLQHFAGRRREPGAIKQPYRKAGLASEIKKDVDNFAKLIMDAANGILYDDDAQVVMLIVGKQYDSVGWCLGRTTVAVEPFEGY